MELRDVLKEVVEKVPGARYASICGVDGLPVDTWSGGDDGDAALLGPEISTVFMGFGRDKEADAGPKALTIELPQGPVFARTVNADYFIFLAAGHDAVSGRARHVLKLSIPKVAALL